MCKCVCVSVLVAVLPPPNRRESENVMVTARCDSAPLELWKVPASMSVFELNRLYLIVNIMGCVDCCRGFTL